MQEINIKKVKPLFTKILLTKNEYSEAPYIPGTQILDATKSKQGIMEYQTVVAVGDMVRNVKEGDIVAINPKRYAVKKYDKTSMKEMMEEYTNEIVGYAFPTLDIGGKEFLFLDESDIDFVITEYETV